MDNSVLLKVNLLKKTFVKKSGNFLKREKTDVFAVNNVNFEIKKGEILGIIGESGCGKTTTARMVMRLMKETSGEIWFNGVDLCKLKESETNQVRKKCR